MTSRRLILVTAALVLIPSGASAHTPAPAVLSVSTAGQRALKADGVTLTAVAPASRAERRFLLPITKAVVTTGATVDLGGTLRLKAGKRKLELKALQLGVGSKSIAVSAKAGGRKLTLFAVTPTRPATLNKAAGSLSLTSARFALTKAAATRIQSALRLKRAPSRKALGTLQVVWVPHDHAPAVVPAPQPIVTTPAATPTPAPTPAPTPEPACPSFSATPAGSVDWFSCDLPAAGNLRSWTEYVQRQWPAVAPCPQAAGSITTSGGAQRIDPASAYDHRFPVTNVTEVADETTIELQGAITYLVPAHGVDERIGELRIVLDADGVHGAVYADGQTKPFDISGGACGKPPQLYSGERVLDLDLTGIAPVTAGGVKRWIHVPATVVAGSEWIVGGEYDGRPWGSFTIAVPAR